MGLSPISTGACETPSWGPIATLPLPNPNPKNFRITQGVQMGDHVVAEIRYPDCTNYEGHKLMVFRNTLLQDLMQRKEIDPHFCEHDHSPFARFEPTKEGWKIAMEVAKLL